MIDSDDTSALDDYGVWVKKNPKDISQEGNEETKEESFDITSDLPDFSNLENSADSDDSENNFDTGETALTSEELLNIADNIDSSSIESAPVESEEDSFIDIPEIDLSSTDENSENLSASDEPVIEETITEDSIASEPSPEISIEGNAEESEGQEDSSQDDAISDILKQNTQVDDNAPLVAFDDSDDFAEEPMMNTPMESEETSVSDFGNIEEEVISEEASNEEPSPENSFADISFEENPEQTPINETETDETSKESSIPDTFEEETSLFTDESDSAVNQKDDIVPIGVPAGAIVPDTEETISETPAAEETSISEKAQNDIISQSNAILLQIQKELSTLQTEITSLKNDFNQFKAEKNAAIAEPPKEDEGGFFSGDDEDETISLSGDELSNIMTNADSTEEINSEGESLGEPIIEESDGLSQGISLDDSMPENTAVQSSESIENDNSLYSDDESEASDEFDISFDEEKIEEPAVDEMQLEDEDSDESSDIPQELSVPKVEDVLVESTDTEASDSESLETETADSELSDFGNSEETISLDSDLPTVESVISEEPADEPVENDSLDAELPTVDSIIADSEPQTEESEQTIEEQSPSTDSPFIDDASEEDSMFGDIPSVAGDEPAVNADNSEEVTVSEPETNEISLENKDLSTEDDNIDLSADLSTEEAIDNFYPKSETAEELTEDKLNYLAEEAKPENLPAIDDEITESPVSPAIAPAKSVADLPGDLTKDIKAVLSYMDQLLENLPDEKISEFAQSEQFVTYKKLFTELGLA